MWSPFLRSDQNLRCPHIPQQQQLSINTSCRRSTSAANPRMPPLLPTDGTDAQPFCDATGAPHTMLTAQQNERKKQLTVT